MPTTSKNSNFNLDLCRAMLAENILLNKLAIQSFNSCLAKYTGQNIPVESTLRFRYIDECYTEKMNKNLSMGKKIWTSMDEMTDIQARPQGGGGRRGVRPFLITIDQHFILPLYLSRRTNHNRANKIG